MTAVSDRVAFKQLVATTLASAFAAQTSNPDLRGVAVHYGDPGELVTDEMVMLGRVEGNSTATVFGPAGNDDEFTITATIVTDGHATEQEADQRAQLILNKINAALFHTKFAASLQGRAFPGRQDGPNGDPPLDGQPAVSVVELTIGCSIAVRGS